MDFGAILAPSWEPKCSQNRYKRVLENDEKMMVIRMAKKLILVATTARETTIPEPGEEERRRGKPLLQGVGGDGVV